MCVLCVLCRSSLRMNIGWDNRLSAFPENRQTPASSAEFSRLFWVAKHRQGVAHSVSTSSGKRKRGNKYFIGCVYAAQSRITFAVRKRNVKCSAANVHAPSSPIFPLILIFVAVVVGGNCEFGKWFSLSDWWKAEDAQLVGPKILISPFNFNLYSRQTWLQKAVKIKWKQENGFVEQAVAVEARGHGADSRLLWQPFSDGSSSLLVRLARDTTTVSISN